MARFRTFREWLKIRLEGDVPGGTSVPTKASPNMDLASKAVTQATTDIATTKKVAPNDLTSTPAGQAEIMKKAQDTAKKINPAATPNVADMATVVSGDDKKAAMRKR